MSKEMGFIVSFYDGEDKIRSIPVTDEGIYSNLPSIIEKVLSIDDNEMIVTIDQNNVQRYKTRGPLNETLVKKNLKKKSTFVLNKRQCKLIITLKNPEIILGEDIIYCDTVLIWYTNSVIVQTYSNFNL